MACSQELHLFKEFCIIPLIYKKRILVDVLVELSALCCNGVAISSIYVIGHVALVAFSGTTRLVLYHFVKSLHLI